MDELLHHDRTHLPELIDRTADLARDLLGSLDTRPVVPSSAVQRELGERPAEALPERGRGLEAALAHFDDRWSRGITGSAGPRYLGFVTGGSTPASVAGDWITSAIDQNAADADVFSAGVEREVIGWLREIFGLSSAHAGTFVSGATVSNFVGLAVGREWVGEQLGVSVSRDGVRALGDVPVLSARPHASILKALSMLGLGRDSVRRVPTLTGREAVDVAALRAALAALEGRPAIVSASAGTVNSGDYDDLRAIAALKSEFPFWLHVDAAFGAFAALSPEHAHLLDGLDEADSICVDLHKWLNVPYDSAVQLTRRRDLQVAAFHNDAVYLGAPDENPGFLHLTPENSRRLRALPAWFSLVAYGVEGQADIVRRNIAAADRLGRRLQELPGVRLAAPVRLNIVCFEVPGDVDAFLAAVAETGETFLTPTVYNGRQAVRAAFSNWRTTPEDEDRIFDAIAKVVLEG